MKNNITTIVMAGGKGTRLGVPKIYYQFRNKPLWSIIYDKFINHTNSVLIIGLDIESEKTRIKSLIQALKTINTEKVLIVDINIPLITESLIEKIVSKSNYPSVTAITYLEETIYNCHNKNYDESLGLCKIEPIQLFDKDALLHALLEFQEDDEIEIKEFTHIFQQATGVNPVLIEATPLECFKLIFKKDAFVIENIMKASQVVVNPLK